MKWIDAFVGWVDCWMDGWLAGKKLEKGYECCVKDVWIYMRESSFLVDDWEEFLMIVGFTLILLFYFINTQEISENTVFEVRDFQDMH